MTLFSSAASAALAQTTVRATIGACFYFDSGPEYYLRSADSRISPGGIKWKGASNFVAMEGLQFGIGRRTQPVTLTIAGLPGSTWIALARDQADVVRGRRIEFFLHQFKPDWGYVDPPTSLGVYIMDKLTPSFDVNSQMAIIKLTCEPIGVSKFRAPNSYLDPRDQKARHPGDTGLDLMQRYVVNQTLPPW